jgi:hypothetical protein
MHAVSAIGQPKEKPVLAEDLHQYVRSEALGSPIESHWGREQHLELRAEEKDGECENLPVHARRSRDEDSHEERIPLRRERPHERKHAEFIHLLVVYLAYTRRAPLQGVQRTNVS